MKGHLTLCLLATSLGSFAADTPPQTGHDESLYGKRLPYHKVENVGPCMAAEVVGNRLYAIGQGNLYVLDITQPETPRLLGKLSGLGTTRQITVRDDLAYITARQDGLWIVDISDSARPVLVSHYDSVEMATGIWVSGKLAYIAERCYGIETVDISNPRKVRHVSMLKTPEAQSCWSRDNLLYIGDWSSRQLMIGDMTNPREPVILGAGPLDGYGDGGCLRGKYCYAATGHHNRDRNTEEGFGKGHGLEIWDVSDPRAPAFVSRVKFPPFYSISIDTWAASVAGDYCFAADTHNGVFVIKVDDPAKPAIVAHAQLPVPPGRELADPVGGIALGDGVIYAAGVYSGLYVVSAPGMASPVVREADTPPVLPAATDSKQDNTDFLAYRPDGQVHSATLQGDLAWLACGSAGIQTVRLGDRLELVASHPTKEEACFVSCLGNRLFSAEGLGGMGIYDIGQDLRLTEIGRLNIPGKGVKQVVVPEPGRYALVHCGGAEVLVVDLTSPDNPKVVFNDRQVGLFYGDQLVDKLCGGRYLVAYWQRSGPAWYDVSGDKPVHGGNTPDDKNYSWTDGICAFRDSLLVVNRGKYYLPDVNEKRSMSSLPAYGVDGLRIHGRPEVDGNLLAVSSRHERTVQVLDIEDVTKPRLLREYSLTGNPGACSFWKGRLVIPAAYQGLLLEREKAGK